MRHVAAAADLFGDTAVPGLALFPDLIDPTQERLLCAAIDASGLAPFRFQGWQGHRLTASFGWSFDFTTGRMTRAADLPDFLLPVRDRLAAAAGIDAALLEQALLIRYDPGAGIGWHRDRPHYEHVLGLSLGSHATLRLRQRVEPKGFRRATVALVPRGAYCLDGEVRHTWEHSIAPGHATRWSITFRSLSDLGRRVLGG